MNATVAERRVLRAPTGKIPPAANGTYELGQEVLVHSEQNKEWLGPVIVFNSNARLVIVCTINENIRKTFRPFQTKLYYPCYNENL